MQFNSFVFILIFAPLMICGYFSLNKFFSHTIAKWYFLIMSIWFYTYTELSFGYYLLGSIVFNFAIAFCIYRVRDFWKKCILLIGIIGNVGALFVFKYGVWLYDEKGIFALLVPLGISFLTFRHLSYIIDVYKDEKKRCSFLDYAVYSSYFPLLTAGPIVKCDSFIMQLNRVENQAINETNVQKGIMAFVFGLAKKILIADALGIIVDWCFANIFSLSSLDVIIAMLSYTLQIYFDFSGYCDMASGISIMLNIELPVNFCSPYKAIDIVEFWKRWHMTLTSFFRTYVYFPLGGNRKGALRKNINILFVFLISGLWHGANWTFIVWGAMHGFANIIIRATKKYISVIPKRIQWVTTFVFLNITWLIFRANSLYQVGEMIRRLGYLDFFRFSREMIVSNATFEYKLIEKLLSLFSVSVAPEIYCALLIWVALVIVVKLPNVQEKMKTYSMHWGSVIGLALLFVYTVLSITGQTTFLYMNY